MEEEGSYHLWGTCSWTLKRLWDSDTMTTAMALPVVTNAGGTIRGFLDVHVTTTFDATYTEWLEQRHEER